MASSTEIDSRLKQILIPTLHKIIKNASWRKNHSNLSQQSKSLLDRLSSPSSPTPPRGPLSNLPLPDSEAVLALLISACSSTSTKIAEPALDCIQQLISHALLRGDADPSSGASDRLLAQLVEAACGCHALPDESVELLVLKTLLSAVTSPSLRVHGDSILLIVRAVHDLYLGSKNPVNQMTAKACLIQMLVIVFRRMEADSSTVPVQPIVVADLVEDGNAAPFVQGFITRIVGSGFEPMPGEVEGVNPAELLDSTDRDLVEAKYWEMSMYKSALEGRKDELGGGEREDEEEDDEVGIGSKLRRDAFLVFRALCKLSMKTLTKEGAADASQMKGKILALELVKILLENAGSVFRTSERYVFVEVAL